MSEPTAAALMRALPARLRDTLIATADNVLDLRPRLEFKGRQRALLALYRKPLKPPPGGLA